MEKTKMLACINCSKVFKHRQSKSKHMKSCGKENSQVFLDCDTCSYKTVRKDSLLRHKRMCKGVRHKPACQICSKEFSCNADLKRHMITHEKTSLVCDYCEKVYLRKDHFTQHQIACPMNPNKIIPLFVCEYCDKSFAKKQSLEKHVRFCSSFDRNEQFESSLEYVAQDICPLDLTLASTSSTNDIPSMVTMLNHTDSIAMVNSENDVHFNINPVEIVVPVQDPASNLAEISSTFSLPPSETVPLPSNSSSKLRVQQNRLSNDLSEILLASDLDDNLKVAAVINSMKRLDLKQMLSEKLLSKSTNRKKSGRKMTSFETRLLIWEFWHSSSTTSTITNRPAQLKVRCKPKIQLDLAYSTSVRIIKNKRNVELYQNIWQITSKTLGELHRLYNIQHPQNIVSYGTFLSLKPFYIRPADEKELSMCLCKMHLHIRRAVDGIVKLCEKQNIPIPFDSYTSFFEHIQSNCPRSNLNSYLPWSCTPDKKHICAHQELVWTELKKNLSLKSDSNVTRNFQYFDKKDVEKDGITNKRLSVVTVQADITYLLNFVNTNLTRIVHHRNLLGNFRLVYPKVLNSLSTIEIAMDFSENLTLNLPEEIQSMYWGQAKTSISIHSGIVKYNGNKVYHPYLSDDLNHDQAFVSVTLDEILDSIDVIPGTTVIITSDNCTSQYKSAKNFYDLQQHCNKYNINLIRIYGVAGHGKNEVDTVGGVAKISLRTAISRGQSFFNATDCLDYLSDKFANNSNPTYDIKVISLNSLNDEREKAKYIKCPTIQGSSSFQVLLLEPNSNTIKVAPYLCGCDQCLDVKYGSCSLFTSIEPQYTTLNKVCLRTDYEDHSKPAEDDEELCIQELICSNTICAIAADDRSPDTVWFVYVVESECTNDGRNDYKDI